MIIQHKCFECGFNGEIETEGRRVKCPSCGTSNDFWLKEESPPDNHITSEAANKNPLKCKCGGELKRIAADCYQCELCGLKQALAFVYLPERVNTPININPYFKDCVY